LVTRPAGVARRTRSGAARRWRPRRPGPGLRALLALLVVVAAVIVVVTNPLGGRGGPRGGAAGNHAATSLATVVRRTLASRTQVDGRLGYAGSSSIVVPAGTSLSDLRQARQTEASARAALAGARASFAADREAAAEAQAKVAADRRKLASDCAGANAAAVGSGNGPNDGSGSGAGTTPCATAAQTLTTDEQAATTAVQKATTDRGTIASAQATLSGAREALTAAESAAVAYDTGATFTMLPSTGAVVRRGRPLYAIGDQPVLLLYGRASPWRTFRAGMTPGPDVAELNANLRALGYGVGLAGDGFGAATERAIEALQAAHGLARTGRLRLGSVAFKGGPVRVKGVTPTLGAAVQAGPVLTVSSTRHQVTIALDAARQSEVKAGDKVTITLPDTRTTRGVVSSVGSVASTPAAGETPKIGVRVRLADPAVAGHLDQAPVTVSITTATAKNVLAVPVNALLALAGGGYAVEEVQSVGVHRLVPVGLALVDDSEGLVQVTGSGLHAGQRIVVPAS
jgi:peptidoglycan hydrolase-like protein with peptidoglycan-binding domain